MPCIGKHLQQQLQQQRQWVQRQQGLLRHLGMTYGTSCRLQQLQLQPQQLLRLVVVMLCWVCRLWVRRGP
jgi:hypothetical protein